MKTDLSLAQNKCFELLPKVSRSFALAIEALPNPSRDYVCVSYLLCRIVDTIEDHPELQEKGSHFDCFDNSLLHIENFDSLSFEILENINAPQSWDDELMKNCRFVFQFYRSFPKEIRNILQRNIFEMSQGMRDYTARGGKGGIILESNEDLDRYCYYVAGTVGNLLTEVFAFESGINDPRWIQAQKIRGYHFALGLQKVNMIKDVVQDLQRGSIFLPQAWLNQFNLSPSDLMEGGNNSKVRSLLFFFIRQAASHLEMSRDYILNLPKNQIGFRLFCIWPYTMAIDTLIKGITKQDLFTREHEIKVSRPQMYRMMKLTSLLAPKTTLLKLYFNSKISSLHHLLFNKN